MPITTLVNLGFQHEEALRIVDNEAEVVSIKSVEEEAAVVVEAVQVGREEA